MSIQLQTAFFDVQNTMSAREAWVVTVFEDGDPRVNGCAWLTDDNVIYLSDELFAMYCADEGIDNDLRRALA